MDTIDMNEAEKPVPRKRKPAHGRVLPKPGALDRAYQWYAGKSSISLVVNRGMKRGVDYMTRAELMRAIGQAPSVYGHINKGRNCIHVNDALKISDILGKNVEDLFVLDDRVEEIVRKHRRERFAEWKKQQDDAWNALMGSFRLPLVRHDGKAIVPLLLQAPRLHFVPPETRDVDLSGASLIDELVPRLKAAERKARAGSAFLAAKEIDDFVQQISAQRPWNLLAARYVERRMIDEDDLDAYGEPNVEAGKVLVVKLSRRDAEPDFRIDRSAEARHESNSERWSDADFDAGMSELTAWGGEFWTELSGWDRGQTRRKR